MPSSAWKRESSSRCRRICRPDTADTLSPQHRPSIVILRLDFRRYSRGRIAIRPRASPPRPAFSTAQRGRARFSRRLFLGLSPLDSPLTTSSLRARCPVLGETVTRTRKRRQFARIPQATVQRMRKYFIICLSCIGFAKKVALEVGRVTTQGAYREISQATHDLPFLFVPARQTHCVLFHPRFFLLELVNQ